MLRVDGAGSYSQPARVRAALLANRAIACVHSNRLDRCRDSLHALAKVEAMDESVLTLLDAATALRRRDPKRAKQTLANRRGAAAKHRASSMRSHAL